MKRKALTELLEWKDSPIRCPLLVRGARQVGKSHLVTHFGQNHFKHLCLVNFEQSPEYKTCFETRDPKKIVALIEALSGISIIPDETLLFLDEIQECPEAIIVLRYFKEQLPELHVVGAGSLLEFALCDENFRMPVGRVQFLYLKPLTFYEFLDAAGHVKLREYLQSYDIANAIETPIHEKLLDLMREYSILGGMPAVLNAYFETHSFLIAQQVQRALLASYRLDFGKYAKHTQHLLLETLLKEAPQFISHWVKFHKIDPDVRAATVRQALNKLAAAGLIYPVYKSAASGLPLTATMDFKKFKLLFIDIGLANCSSLLSPELLLNQDLFLLNEGALSEQLVGQELMALQAMDDEPHLFFWCRETKNSQAEVDYLLPVAGNIVPIEVKAGSTGRLKSLQLFMEEKNSAHGLRVWAEPPSWNKHILSVPFYLIQEIPRLLENKVQ
jgi:predicted AAA+ superfamily ATPase